MRIVAILLTLLVAPAERAKAEARPVSLPKEPAVAVDYIARFSERLGRETRIVYRRNTTVVVVSRKGGTQFHSLQISRGAEPGFSVSEAVRTGRSENLHGGRCDVWSTATTSVYLAQPFSTEHCLTPDGIELGYRLLATAGSVIIASEAVAVERRSVDPAEVEIPAEVFERGYWTENDARTMEGAPADFETTFLWPAVEPGRPRGKQKTTRRHFPWSLQSTVSPVQRELVIHNLAGNVMFRLDTIDDGAYEKFLVMRETPPLGTEHAARLERSDVVHGERCDWYDMHPGMMDAGLNQCRTHDGIVLKETQIVRAHGETVEAAQFQRRPVDLSQVMPPPDILTRAYWGLPQ
jgi:hypothetical protein